MEEGDMGSDWTGGSFKTLAVQVVVHGSEA